MLPEHDEVGTEIKSKRSETLQQFYIPTITVFSKIKLCNEWKLKKQKTDPSLHGGKAFV